MPRIGAVILAAGMSRREWTTETPTAVTEKITFSLSA